MSDFDRLWERLKEIARTQMASGRAPTKAQARHIVERTLVELRVARTEVVPDDAKEFFATSLVGLVEQELTGIQK